MSHLFQAKCRQTGMATTYLILLWGTDISSLPLHLNFQYQATIMFLSAHQLFHQRQKQSQKVQWTNSSVPNILFNCHFNFVFAAVLFYAINRLTTKASYTNFIHMYTNTQHFLCVLHQQLYVCLSAICTQCHDVPLRKQFVPLLLSFGSKMLLEVFKKFLISQLHNMCIPGSQDILSNFSVTFH